MAAGADGPAAPGVSLRRTTAADRGDLLRLWNDGRVMALVGFPDGLGLTPEAFDDWLAWVEANPARHHFVVHAPGIGFGGEVYAAICGRAASLDVKLVPEARGRGLAATALAALIDWVFAAYPEVEVVSTEPAKANAAAKRLYARCGLAPVPGEGPTPDHERWERRRP